jgi:Mitochondrial carrier protein
MLTCNAGFMADLCASIIYVPSEVLKTRLQLQGRRNNPFFKSGYNYRGTADATRTIIRQEGWRALFHGYKATIFRDLPFSALQFTFYEQFQKWAKQSVGGGQQIGLGYEILTGGAAGGLAGVITCPLDVVKTRLQTQVTPRPASPIPLSPTVNPTTTSNITPLQHSKPSNPITSAKRLISTSSPSTSTRKPGTLILNTSSVYTGLRLIYKAEGLAGWFRGVGPRFIWTSVQSATMLVLYQTLLRKIAQAYPENSEGDGAI